MRKFDTYSPELGVYGEDMPLPVVNPNNNGENKDYSKQDNATDKKSGKKNKAKTNRDLNKSWSANSKDTSVRIRFNKIKSFFTHPMVRVLTGIFLIFLAAYLLISLISYISSGFVESVTVQGIATGNVYNANYGGEGGARLSELLVNEGFGIGAFIIIFWLIALSLKLLTKAKAIRFKTINFTIKCLIALITVSLIIGLLTIGLDVPFNLGGAHGRYVNQLIIDYIGWGGAILLCLFMVTLFIGICLNDFVQWIIRKRKARAAILAEKRALREEEEARLNHLEEMKKEDLMEDAKAGEQHIDSSTHSTGKTPQPSNVDFNHKTEQKTGETPEEEDMTYIYEDEEDDSGVEPKLNIPHSTTVRGSEDKSEEKMVMQVNVNQIATVDEKENRLPNKVKSYHYPPVGLLRPSKERIELDRNEQLENKEKIRRTLLDFGIPIKEIYATVGPTVTLYEIIPEAGIKIASIRSRDEDIARSLSAVGVRIIAPMPGKGTVGIEVPNKDPQIVSMRTVITSRKFHDCKYELPMAIGSTIANEVYIADLTKMPHLLVAGATGQGKSVGLNAIITSLLYRKNPEELKFVLIDPKMVELSLYSLIEKHFLARMPGEDEAIITDVTNKVIPALSSLCVEMDARYELLKSARVRAIKEYNEKFKRGELNPEEGHRFMPYIVVVVDEYSDLVMTAGKEVEKPIARLAQKARAIGIHLIVATQRPSTDVVTGMIKANFPARMAFKVSSGVDSKTILNTTAAAKLIGRGDMLISTGSELERVQCAFIDTPEVEDICTFISQQPCEVAPYVLPEPIVSGDKEDSNFDDSQPVDPLLVDVARQIINLDQASTSGIQRRYNIGYNRAGRIMDQLERLGVVGPSHGGKPRAILVDPPTLESILQSAGIS